MRMKKLFSLLCAATVTLSAVGGLPAGAEASTGEETLGISEAEKLPAPTNVYVDENDVIRWDAVEWAKSYQVEFTVNLDDGGECSRILYTNTNSVSLNDWKKVIFNSDCFNSFLNQHNMTVRVFATNNPQDETVSSGSFITVSPYLLSSPSEPISVSYSIDSFKANFKFDEATGTLSWDLCEEADAYYTGKKDSYFYLLGKEETVNVVDSSDLWSFRYFNEDTGKMELTPKVPLVLSLASNSCFDSNPMIGEMKLKAAAYNSTEDSINYVSSDSFTYHYDGCDVNSALPAPQNIQTSDGKSYYAKWNPVDGAIGYLIEVDNFTDQGGTYSTTEYFDKYVFPSVFWVSSDNIEVKEGIYQLKICAVDKNGDRGEWSEPVTIEKRSVTLPAPTNVSVDENDVIRWDTVEGATGYTVRLANKTGADKTFSVNTNYLDDWKLELSVWNSFYTRDHALTVSVAAVDASGKEGEYSEPVDFTYSMKPWNANFKYETETGYLTWDNWTNDVSNGNLNYYLWGLQIPWTLPPNSTAADEGYWNPALSGYYVPSINLPLELAYRTLAYPDADFRGDHTLWLTSCALGSATAWWTDKVGDHESTDTFTYSYDGCDVNPALKPPTENVCPGNSRGFNYYGYVASWDPVDDAVGYVVRWLAPGEWDNADSHYTTAMFNDLFSIGSDPKDGLWRYEICSIDKNGDRSEWSEEYSIWVEDGKIVGGLDYPYLNNVDSEGNLLLREAEGAVRYTVEVTGNGANLSLESTTTTIAGFTEGLKSFPAGEYQLLISAYNSEGIRRQNKMTFNKEEEGFFNEANETGSTVESAPEAAGIPESDKIPAVGITPAFNLTKKGETDVFFNIGNIKIKAKEIYDEEGLKRAEEALGEEIIGNKHYNLLDLTLWEGDTDISNGYEGLVKVTIPLPTGHLGKTFHVYRFVNTDGKWGYEEIPGEQTEDSYIIYLEHFSEYALVADGGETPDEPAHTHTFPDEWKSDGNSHWHECSCGEKSGLAAHTAGEWIVNSAAGYRYRDCTVCGAVLETVSLSGGSPSGSRPVTNPSAPTGTTNTENTDKDNSSDPAGPKDEDAEKPEPDEADEEGDVDTDTDENDGDDDEEDNEDNEPEDDGYDDTFSKDDTDGNDAEESSPIVTPEAVARDENPGTGVSANAAMIFGFLISGAAAFAAFSKRRK